MAAKQTPSKPTSRGQDDRVARNPAAEQRGDRGTTEDHSRTSNDGLLSTDELQKLVESEFEQTALPSAPKLNGFHLVWLTTASQYDAVQKRERIGYSAVRRDEMPGFDPSNGHALGGYENFVTCNEMVLFKIPEARYQAIMNLFHHKKPMEEEAGILSALKEQQGAAGTRKNGQNLLSTEGEGHEDMEAGVRAAQRAAPVF